MMNRFVGSLVLWTLSIIAVTIGMSSFEMVRVSLNSMEQTMHPKDVLVVLRLRHWMPSGLVRSLLRARQIVVFRTKFDRSTMFVKRIVGTGGDKVRISKGALFVNQIRQDEPYLASHTGRQLPDDRSFGEVDVSPGGVFVLGDNRPESVDSRLFGSILVQDISGIVVAVFHEDRGLPGFQVVTP
jgi:signal peptidase I